MFCQKIKTVGRFNKTLLRKNPTQNVLNASVYNDSMPEKAREKPRRRVTEVYTPPELNGSTFTSIFTKSGHMKKDWLEDFRRTEFTPWAMWDMWKTRRQDRERAWETVIECEHESLGSDLAAARYIVYRNGRARFRGNPKWCTLGSKPKLPLFYTPNLVLEELDCSGLQMPYEGIQYLIHLNRLKTISFKGNNLLDDFCMDSIGAQFPNLEVLDISECPKVTERGIEALYKMFRLKKLIVTNYNDSLPFELTCLMLEECLPHLQTQLLLPEPKEEPKSLPEGEKKKGFFSF